MKKLILSLVAIATLSLSSFGQAPEGFKYQAVVRDAGNTILNNQAVGMRMTIQQGSIGGTAVYQETFSTTTNGYGLVNLEIGNGTVVTGTFATIDWANGPYFIETAVDVTGGTSYTVMGTSQLMSVPYALYAKTSGSSIPGPQGPAGNDGAQGLQGIQGPAGNDGAVGATGATGPQGPAGNDGAVGAQGPQGIQGTPGSQDAWSLTGNAGTNPSTNFIGTTNAQDWVMRTNNLERARIMSNGNVGIGINSPTTKLQVAGDIFAFEGSYLLFGSPIITNYSNNPGSLYSSRAVGGNYPFATTGNVILQSTTALNRDILFVTGTAPKERMVVKANGDVGINTPLPSGRFHVNNDVTGADSSFVISNSGLVGMGMTPTMRLDVWPSGTITDQQVMRVTGYVLDNPSSPPIAAIRGGGDGASVFEISKPSGPARNFAQLRMGVDGTLGSIYSNGGNFGININNPARSLHIKDVMRLEPIPTAPSSPAKGDIYFDSTLNKLRVYDGTIWQNCW